MDPRQLRAIGRRPSPAVLTGMYSCHQVPRTQGAPSLTSQHVTESFEGATDATSAVAALLLAEAKER